MALPPVTISSGASIAGAARRITSGITQTALATSPFQPPTNNNFANRSSIRGLRFPLDMPKHVFNIGISSFNRIDFFSFSLIIGSSIALPIPKQLVDNDMTTYEQEELQTAGAAAQAATRGASAILSDPSEIGSQMLNALSAGGLIASTLGQSALGQVMAGINSQLGQAPNQFLTVLLKGPAYKKHEFSWTLAPRNAAESEAIRNIILTLKRSMAVGKPTATGLGFFGAPAVFGLSFLKDTGGSSSNVNQYLYRFKPCVLENMSVNYTPSSAPAFYAGTGAPDAVELRLSFLEIEFWFREDY